MLPHSDACERNKGPILEILREVFAGCTSVLEIGSGTGQHAVHFATEMPWLVWQPSERADTMPGLRVTRPPWDVRRMDGVFTANTLHIMSWPEVEALFANLPAILKPGAVLVIYGPFRYAGEYTSESNASFDEMLHARDPQSGIRDFEAVDALARGIGFVLQADHRMPANNQTLVWKLPVNPA
jgi:SAM-dependent methyltransferase